MAARGDGGNLVVLCTAAAAAQTTLGRVSGSVLDSSGGALPGATITLTNENTNQVQTTVAGENGAYVFPQLPVGSYKVEIALQGFKTATFTQVAVAVGQDYSLTARLELGAITEQIEVVAGSSLVSTTSPEVSATVMQRQVLDIPLVNRDVTNLIKLQPGVQPFMNRTNTSINGGRPTWTTVTLDGINIQDNFIRVNSLDFLPNRPTSDTIAEFSITTSVSGAETAGGASSVRMITPSGTNRFRAACSSSTATPNTLRTRSSTTPRHRRAQARTEPPPVRRPLRRPESRRTRCSSSVTTRASGRPRSPRGT